MIAPVRPVAFPAVLLASTSSGAFAVEPSPGQHPLIRSWAYRRGVSLDLTSFGGAPVVLVLAPGETVKHHSSQFVSRDAEQAGRVGWHMPDNTLVPVAVADQDAEGGGGGGETTNAAAKGGGPPRATVISDQVVLQPLRLDLPPVVLHLVTSAPDGERRSYLLTLRVNQAPLFEPATGRLAPNAYAQVIVDHPAKPDPAALAAAQARREEYRLRRDMAHAQARLAVSQTQPQGAVQDANLTATPGAISMADGRKSPGACDVLRPTEYIDTGRRTTLVFDPRQPRMQLYGFTAAGGEPTRLQAVPENRPDGWFQYNLPGSYQRIALAAENRVCVVKNETYGRVPTPNTTGTSSPDVALVPR